MIDLSEYINEARRDYEMRQILTDVQVSQSNFLKAKECNNNRDTFLIIG